MSTPKSSNYLRPSHQLGECPNGVEWCDPQDHVCEDCMADWTDRVYDELKEKT